MRLPDWDWIGGGASEHSEIIKAEANDCESYKWIEYNSKWYLYLMSNIFCIVPKKDFGRFWKKKRKIPNEFATFRQQWYKNESQKFKFKVFAI